MHRTEYIFYHEIALKARRESGQGHSVLVEALHDRFLEAIKGCVRGGALLARQHSSFFG